MRRGDWMKLNCGDTVHDRADPRHTGRVNSIHRGAARVEWNETGWTSEVPVHHLKKAKATRGFSFSEREVLRENFSGRMLSRLLSEQVDS
jgi:hypothetical protein